MTPSEPYPGTQTVLRAVALLKAFSDDQPEWGLTDLSRALSLNKTTTYRLLTALESEGMVTRAAQGEGYRLGPAAIALGGQALRGSDLRTAARASLEYLAQAVRETVTLEVVVDGEMLILDEVMGSHVLGNVQSLGTRWPLHATSTGKAVLAHITPAERGELLPSLLRRYTDKTVTRLAELRRELTLARQRGYAIAAEELEDGFVAVGAPVRNFAGAVLGAISIGGPSVRLALDRWPELGRLVREQADHVSQRLGYAPDRARHGTA
jgi:DNA-binding IclR family transcriptional regulator